MNKESYYLEVYHDIYKLIVNQELIMYHGYPKQDSYQAGMCFVIKKEPYTELFSIIEQMNGSNYIGRKTDNKRKLTPIGQIAYLDGYFKSDDSLGIRAVRFIDKTQTRKNKAILKYLDIILIHIYRKENCLEGNFDDMSQRPESLDFETQIQHLDSNQDISELQPSLKQKFSKETVTRSNYFTLESSEEYFNHITNLEDYYLKTFSRIYDLVLKNQIKVYGKYPQLDFYEAGTCFVFRRPSDSKLSNFFTGMKVSRFTQDVKRKVQQIGQFVYFDGFFKFQKNLGIRVAKFIKKIKDESTKIFNQTGLVLMHIYERDFQEQNNMSNKKMAKDSLSKNKNDQVKISSCKQMNQYEQKIRGKSLQDYGDSLHLLSQQKQSMQNEEQSQSNSINQQNQFISQEDQKQSKIIYKNQEIVSEKPLNLFSSQQNEQNFTEKSIQENYQLYDQSLCMQKQVIQVKQENINEENQYKLNNNNLKIEPQPSLQSNNQIENVLFQLSIQNNQLKQQVILKEIEQKKKELKDLEEELNQLKLENEKLTKNPIQLNKDYLKSIENNLLK
ncbi:hypothetical protein ABPG72_016227 [Tetrahymena utriculariae]